MKYLKYVLYALIGLFVLFIALGLLNPTVNYGHEFTVNKTAKEAWAVSMDESKYSQWLTGFKSIELLSGEKGKQGSTYKVVVEPGEGQDPFEMIETLVEIKEFEKAKLTFDSEGMEIDQLYAFEEKGGNTTFTSETEVRGKGIMGRSMFALMHMFGMFEAQESENMKALKKLIEENTTDYYKIEEDVPLEAIPVQ
ncbi:MAG: SRPBCC family protein [Saprospiraceae bacterium]|nr:SRPBCC family protein [Saprospiraceae bacterium]